MGGWLKRSARSGLFFLVPRYGGTSNDDSDLDLLVIVGESALPPHKRALITRPLGSTPS